MSSVQSSSLPLRMGTPEQFMDIRAVLNLAKYSDETFYRTFKISQMSDVGGVDLKTLDFTDAGEQFGTLVRIFFGQRTVPSQEVKGVFDDKMLETFLALGLMGMGEFGPDQVYAKVLLYPLNGFFIASDRHTNPDGSEFIAPPDIVFPAIYAGTLRFLRLLPPGPVADSLDLCAGSGIGAFMLSRSSQRAVSSDVTERATHFAEFNRRLNQLENVEVVCGDLYGGVAGRTFDRIVAHPPYVPSLTNTTIWRDGGTTGELLVQRIVQQLPQYLRPGGIACIVSLGLDTKEGRLEERVRQWLGEGSEEFDIIFASTNERTPDEVLRDLTERDPNLDRNAVRGLRVAFVEAGIVEMPYGPLVIRRHSPEDKHDAWTLRTKLSDVTEGADFVRTFLRHQRYSQPDFASSLVHAYPKLAPRLQVRATHVVYENALVPAEFIFETDSPFDVRGRVDSWMVPLFAKFDGRVTPHEIFSRASEAGDLPEGFTLEDFTGLIARMVERAYLVLPES